MNREELAQKLADGEPIDWEATGSDPVVDALKRIHDFNQQFADDAEAEPGEPERRLGQWGSLHLIESIGRGTFGEVYRAFDPVLQRDVALKLVRDPDHCMLDVDDFIAEAQRLAQVRHSNVLAVHGAGVHEREAGFWCELLVGQTLEQALSTGQRFAWEEVLDIARDLSTALAAVHGAGLVHGDIKAANVMLESDRGAVLMDFGAGLDSKSKTENLGISQGTPLVMAPELLDSQSVSQRADVYALGVLLYRLVAGDYPITGESLDEVRRKARQGVSIRKGDLPGAPRPFQQLLRGMLEVDASRRPSAPGLVRCINELIALPEKRNKRRVTLAIASLLVSITVVSSLGFWISRQAQHAAEQAGEDLQSVNGVLTDMLASASPLNEGKDVRVVEVLTRAERELEQRGELSPSARSQVMLTLARTYRTLGNNQDAKRLVDEVLDGLGPLKGTSREWEARHLLAQHYMDIRDWSTARTVGLESLAISERLDPNGESTFENEITLATIELKLNEAEQALVRIQSAISRFSDVSPGASGRAYNSLGQIHDGLSQLALSLEAYERAVAFYTQANGPRNSNTIKSQGNRATALILLGRGQEAAEVMREQLAIANDFLGPNHKITFSIRSGFGAILAELGRIEEALVIQQGVLDSSIAAYGPEHFESLLIRINLAVLMVEVGQLEEAEAAYRFTIEGIRRHYPDEHMNYLIPQFNLAELLNKAGRYDESKVMAEQALVESVEQLGESHIVSMELYESVARSELGLGQAARAAESFALSVKNKTERLGAGHPLTLNAYERLAEAQLELGRHRAARAAYQTALDGRVTALGEAHPDTRRVAELLDGWDSTDP